MSSTEKPPFRRLPTDVLPYHYDIVLSPNLETFIFDGKENVYIDVSRINLDHLFRVLTRPQLPDPDTGQHRFSLAPPLIRVLYGSELIAWFRAWSC